MWMIIWSLGRSSVQPVYIVRSVNTWEIPAKTVQSLISGGAELVYACMAPRLLLSLQRCNEEMIGSGGTLAILLMIA